MIKDTKTYQPKAKDIKRNWHHVDAKSQVLGRMASNIVKLLMGKHKVDYAPHMDMGDYVVVTNASKIEVTGRKKDQKIYYKHSGYPKGFREIKYSQMITEKPERVIELAVRRMLPDNRLRDKRMGRLKVLAGDKNKYADKIKSEK